jgi:hypothetical protein
VINKGDRYILNDAEQRLARYVAQRRTTSNRDARVNNQRIGPQNDADTDLEGIGAEIAFCRLANVYPDLDVSPRAGGYDCTIRFGDTSRTVDVKTTKYPNGRLLAAKMKQLDAAQLYALMSGEFPDYVFCGWAMGDELIDGANLIDLGHGPTYALKQSVLRERLAATTMHESEISW